MHGKWHVSSCFVTAVCIRQQVGCGNLRSSHDAGTSLLCSHSSINMTCWFAEMLQAAVITVMAAAKQAAVAGSNAT
jgi:hypothetical protein